VTKRHSYRTLLMILIISVILMTLINLPAEGREDRRSIEKRADEIVARFPADNARDRDLWAKELIDLGHEGIVAVCRMLASPGASDDSQARFALHGVTMVVNRSGLYRERSLFTKGLLRAMEQERKKEVQAFLIRQLQLSAGDEAVKLLKGYLKDNRLCDPAAQALLAIGTPKAEEAMIKSLKDATGNRRGILIRALGEMRSEKAIPLILPFAMGEEAGLWQVSLFALANIGDSAAEAALIRFPLIASPFDRGQAPSFLLLYARRLGEAGHKKESARLCHQLLNNYTAPQESQIACTALTILVDTLGETALGDLLRAMNSPLKDVRGRALELSLSMPGKSVTTIWMNEAANKDLEVLAEIIVMLGLRGDKAAFPLVRRHLSSPDPGIRTAAVTASVRLGGLEALPDIWPLLESGDDREINAIRDVLLGLPAEQVVPQTVARLAHVPPPSQMALIEVLAARRAGDSLGYVLALSRSEDEALRKTALTALERLVRAQDVDMILELLISDLRRSEIPPVQNALVAAALQAPEPELRAARILEAYEGAAQQHRPDLLRPLARIGGDAAFRLVVLETRNPSDSRIRAAAIYALTQWPDIQAADELLILCRSEEHRRYLYQALQGYIRLVRDANLPAAEKAAMLKEILGLPLGTQEKNAIISGLGSVKSQEGLELASRFLGDPKVRNRAARIMQQIALPEPGAEGLYGFEVASFLKKIQPIITDEYELRSIEHHITKIMTNHGYIALFNGRDLSGWMGDTLGYAAEDRKIVVRPEHGSGNLYTEKEYRDFILRFDFRLTPGANNGLGIRTPPEGNAAYVGMELQILDNSADQYRDLSAYQYHGSIYGVVPAKRGFQRPVGEWNHQEVIARGRRIIVILNGETIVDADIDEASASGTMDGSEHPGLKRTRGHIGFLGHGSRVEFRSLWLKELK